MDQELRKRIGFHEGGHILACYLAFGPYEDPLHLVTICAGEGLEGHVQWADEYPLGDDREFIEKELLTLLGGAVAEEIVFGNSKGMKVDVADAGDLLQVAEWIADKNLDSGEIEAYLEWLRRRLKNMFERIPVRDVLEALATALLERETFEYKEAKNIIEEAIDSKRKPRIPPPDR